MKKALIIIFVILIHFGVVSFLSQEVTANPTPIEGAGGLIPINNTTLQMTDAEVVMEIDATDPSNEIGIDFEGEYTIYNPDNATHVTIGAPFTLNMDGLKSSCKLTLEDKEIPFEIEVVDAFEYTYLGRLLVLCNVSIPENSSIKLRYTFEASIPNEVFDNYYSCVEIVYDVGTAKNWDGKITETVQFRVTGVLPSDNSSGCKRFNEDDKVIYEWKWEDEDIKHNLVYVEYCIKNITYYLSHLYMYLPLIMLIGLPSSGSYFFIKIRKYHFIFKLSKLSNLGAFNMNV